MSKDTPEGDRIAKVLSRAGVASRRDAERMISEGRVKVNGRPVSSPALNVVPTDKLTVDGKPVDAPEPTRLWLYHKPAGLVTSESDELGRPTVFDNLPEGMPRVMSIGRLDLTSEGLLLLTNDGEAKRHLELPATGWLRRYRVRINGSVSEEKLDELRKGITVDEVDYQPMEVTFDRQQGANAWLTIAIREGKNREIRRVMDALGVTVNRLLRVSYGPFKLGNIAPGEAEEVPRRQVRDQLGLDGDEDARPKPVRARKTRGTEGARPAGPIMRSTKASRPGEDAPKPARKTDGLRSDGPRPGPKADGERPAKPYGPRTVAKPYGPRSTEGGERSAPRSYDKPRAEGERPARSYDKPRTEGDRPARSYGDKPAGKFYAPRGAAGAERPARSYDKPRAEGDRPARSYGDKPAGKPYAARADGERPARTYGGKPSAKPYTPRGEQADRPARPYGKPRASEDGPRPARSFPKPRPAEGGERSDRPAGKTFTPRAKPAGDRPYGPKADGARPAGPKSQGYKSHREERGPRTDGDGPRKPYAPRGDGPAKPYAPRGDGPRKPYGPRAEGAARPPRTDGPPRGGPRGGKKKPD